jgi:long-chain acyl-CoA synthetase
LEALNTLQQLPERLGRRGDRTAVLRLQRGESREWTYGELTSHVLDLAHGLRRAGLQSGQHAVIMAPNMPEWIAACLGVLACGGVVVPVDVQSSNRIMEHALQDSQARILFTVADEAPRLDRVNAPDGMRVVLLDAAEDDDRSWLHLTGERNEDLPQVGPNDPAAMFYTSGTTGLPKGVPLTHRNLCYQVNTLVETSVAGPDDTVLLALPFHHVYPFTVGLLICLSWGLKAVIPESLTGPQIVRALREGQVTLLIGVPRLYRALLSGIREKAAASGPVGRVLVPALMALTTWLRRWLKIRTGKVLLHSLHKQIGPHVRAMASGGAALDMDVAMQMEGLGWRVLTGYGLTETSPILTLNTPEHTRFGTAGYPIDGVKLRIDTSARPGGNQDEEADLGEVQARSPGVFSGYHNLPEEDAEAFTDDGWFRTGDLGRIDDDGYLHLAGRVSTVIVTEAGKNVQPGEVEEAYEQADAIEEIGVMGRDGAVVALIVPAADLEDEQDAVRRAVQERSRELPSYERLSDYQITHRELPRTRLGKIRRHLLDERYEEAASGEPEAEPESGPVPVDQMNEEDRTLLDNPRARKVWDWFCERFSDRRLRPDSHLQMDLGLDSLDWVDLTIGIRRRTGVDLTDQAIARIETVRDLLEEVARNEFAGESGETDPLENPDEVLTDEQKAWLQPLSPGEERAARLAWHLNRAACRMVFGVHATGLQNLPRDGQFIITPNHVSYLDPELVAAVLPWLVMQNTSWAGWTGAAFGNPVTRLFSRLAMAVPVNAEQAVLSSVGIGAAVLQRGRNLVWFPEGRRSPRGKLLDFRRGVGMLLDHFQVPVVPVYIRGTFEAMPVGRTIPRPFHVHVCFGEPCNPTDLEQRGNGEDPEMRIVDALRDRVAELGRSHGAGPDYGRGDPAKEPPAPESYF